MRTRLGLPGGVLVCQPLPAELALDNASIEAAIQSALQEAAKQGIRGRTVTPFLLSALSRTTEGHSLAANRALLENNASLAAQISRAVTPPNYV
jgi:pseudouridine-5'-phosphate glycosidase